MIRPSAAGNVSSHVGRELLLSGLTSDRHLNRSAVDAGVRREARRRPLEARMAKVAPHRWSKVNRRRRRGRPVADDARDYNVQRSTILRLAA
jgi:hypothetical protein